MTEVIKCRQFKEIFEKKDGREFYIYGAGKYAQIFYIYCLLNGFEKMIDGVLVSDLGTIETRDKMFHRRKLAEPDSLKGHERVSVVLCLSNDDAKRTVISMFGRMTIDTQIFEVEAEEFGTHWGMYVYQAREYIYKYYDVSTSKFECPFQDVKDKDSDNYYKYRIKLYAGSVPDTRIFGPRLSLDKLHQEQIGPYLYIGQGIKEKPERRFSIYMAKSHMDHEIENDYESLYTIPIQVGAVLTDQKICRLRDDQGENLSLRNRDYCELSAMYWAWKNDKESEYIGLCHYRRRFVLDERQFAFIEENDLDAVYTIPKIIDQGVEYEFVERCNHVKIEAWEYLDRTIRNDYPDYLDAWEKLKKADFLITLNMIIMRRNIYNDYCEWLFGVLEKVDRNYIARGIQPNNRYLGYLGECLTTVYVIAHRDRLKYGYTEVHRLCVPAVNPGLKEDQLTEQIRELEKEKEKADRNNARSRRLYACSMNWLKLMMYGSSPCDYLLRHSYKKVAIYGAAGGLADLLFKVLQCQEDIKIMYLIDKNSGKINGKGSYPVYAPEDIREAEDVDAVIVTAITAYEDIVKNLLKIRPELPVVSLENIISRQLNEVENDY